MTKKRELNRDVFISGLSLAFLYYFFPKLEILAIGGIYLPICFFHKKLKAANHLFWKKTTKILHAVTSPILFGAIFLLILLPLGLLYRLFHQKDTPKNSTFKEVRQTIDASFFEAPW